MSAFVVVEKLSLKKEQIEGEKLVLDQASIIHTKLNRDDVAEFIQEGQHLVLKLKNGEVIIIENFFTQFEQDLVSDLVFEDDECAFLWFDWNNGVPVFKELAGLEALLPIASNAGSIAPLILGGAALVGGGIAIAENRDNDKSPAQPGNTPPQVEVIIDKDGNITIKYPDNVDPESINPDDIIIKDKNGNPIDVGLEKGDDNTLTGKVPDGIDGDITVTVPEGSYEDKDGNPGGEGSDSSEVVPTPPVEDPVAPTVDVDIDDKGNITIKFPDADFDPESFDPKDVIIKDKDGNPIKVEFTPGKDNTWTAKVPSGIDSDITVTVPEGSYADKSGNKGSEDKDTESVDTKAPTVDVDIDKNGNITIKFPDADFDPESFDPKDVIIKDKDGNPIKVEFTPGKDNTWTAKVPEGIDSDITVTVPEGSYADKSGNTGSEDKDTESVDTKAPTVKVDIDKNGNITIKFPDADFDPESFDPKTDVVITGKDGKPVLDKDGNPINVEFTPGKDNTWTAKVPEGIDSDITVTVPENSYADKSGNTGSEGKDTESVDTKAPQAEVIIDEDGKITVTYPKDVDPESIDPKDFIIKDKDGNPIDGVVFDKPIINDKGEIIIGGQVPSNVEGKVTVDVPAGSYEDKAGNPGLPTDAKNDINMVPPTVVVDIDEKGNITIKFPDADFDPESFNPDDVIIKDKAGNPVLDNDGNPIKVDFTPGKDNTWTAKIPEGMEKEITVTVPDGKYADKSGNTGSEGTDTELVDTRTPNVYVNIDEKGNISIEFSPDVDPKSINRDDFIILDQLGNEVVIDLEISEDGLSFTGSVPEDFEGEITVTVPGDTYAGIGGEPGHEDSDSALIDIKAPTVEVTINEDGTVSFKFSEEVKDFNPEDITIENGKISGLRQDPNDPTRWIADLTPDAGVEGDVTVTVKDDSYSDLADNKGKGHSDKITVDTKAPTVKVDIDDVNKNSVTFTFSEIPHGADGQPLTAEELKALIKSENADIDFDNLVTEDGGLTWTAPIQAKHEGEIKIEIAVDEDHFYKDAAGNTGTPGKEAVVIVKPPKVEQETALIKPEITGGTSSLNGGPAKDTGAYFESSNDKHQAIGQHTSHILKFDIPVGQNTDTVRGVINLDTLDNSFMILVNGDKIANTDTFQVESGDLTNPNQINLLFSDGTWLSAGEPWNENKHGLPRFQIVITENGIRFYATRTTTSKQLEEIFFQNDEDLKKLNDIVFKEGANEITVINTDGTGKDAIKGYLTLTVGGQFIISDEDSAELQSMIITLTGAQTGDDFIPVLPLGISGKPIYKDGVLTLELTGKASVKDYQDALNALMFKGTENGKRNISIKVKDSSGLESEIANGSIDYKVSEGTITIGQFDYSVSKVAALSGDDEISTGDTGHDALIYDVLDAADAKAGHGVDTWSDFHLGAMADDANADVIQFSQDFFDGLLDDQSNISEFISVDYDAATQQAIISIDRDGQGVGYGQEKFLVLDNQTQDFDLQKLLENQQIIIG